MNGPLLSGIVILPQKKDEDNIMECKRDSGSN